MRATRPAVLFLALATLGLADGATRSVAGQVVRGTVVDDQNLARVLGATVRLVVGEERTAGTETDANGAFLLALPGKGEYRLEVSRLGYRTALSQTFIVAGTDTLSVEFRVSPDAILLDPITVTGKTHLGRRVFERHRDEWRKGFFFDAAQVDSVAPQHPAQVYDAVEKAVVHWGWGQYTTGGYGPVPSVQTFLGRGCMLYMVDWVPVIPDPLVRQDWASDQLGNLQQEDVVAVEVYRSVTEVPPELQRYTHRFRFLAGGAREDMVHCGLTVFWTRQGW